MAKKNAFIFSYTLLLPIFVTNLVVGSHYSTYIEYGLEDEKICYPAGPQKKSLPRLGDNEKSAVLVRARHIFDYWFYDWLSDRTCRFVIKASKGDGLCAVIQKMSFRRRGNDCLDYVQFAWANGSRTEKLCGYIDRNRTIFDPQFESPETRNSSIESYDVLDHRGQLETYIFISKEKPPLGRSLDLSIVYTQYKDCKRADPEVYKSVKTPNYRDVCIRHEYFCDGYQNCPLNLCQDELDCDNNIKKFISDGTGTKVTIGAVTTIILCFIIFVLCLYICKKHNKLCWSEDCAGRRPTVIVHHSSSSNPAPIPTAPMLEVAMPLSTVDKDLPPSYDSLFPEPSNRTTS